MWNEISWDCPTESCDGRLTAFYRESETGPPHIMEVMQDGCECQAEQSDLFNEALGEILARRGPSGFHA